MWFAPTKTSIYSSFDTPSAKTQEEVVEIAIIKVRKIANRIVSKNGEILDPLKVLEIFLQKTFSILPL